ncbi:MAG: bacillithiol biosynthesis cysteine-adding enzyme BshC, partial [Flavobacteriales bacterium]|nr:bacillithiol biosynthesis cysteine-adding enzyme BshC [Flavobacteriales bacterium]
MNKLKIPYHQTGYFSSMMLDYLEGKESLRSFYNNSVSVAGFEKQLEEKQFNAEQRNTLCEALEKQYAGISMPAEVASSIKTLGEANTFTVTTGHQLNLFTGPLYYLYKIVSTINLAKTLKDHFPGKNFIPVFWMATEDHDLEEVNHFSLFGVKHELASDAGGAVGRMKLNGVERVFQQLEETLNGRTGLEAMIHKLKAAYQAEHTYTKATQIFINELFGSYGLVIIDGDDPLLKASFAPYMEQELLQQKNVKQINESSDRLEALGYKKQVNPREINLFYLQEGLRERIIQEGDAFRVNNNSTDFTQEELLNELENYPERFSPNAVLRPLYQEVVLPNLAYIGGGGELAYWLQLKAMFESNQIAFPVLVLRNSALIIDQGTQKKINKLELTIEQLFLDEEELIRKYLKATSDFELDL